MCSLAVSGAVLDNVASQAFWHLPIHVTAPGQGVPITNVWVGLGWVGRIWVRSFYDGSGRVKSRGEGVWKVK